ncbi:hypothetical protein EYW49_11105 [Siculibacillus lacustris]|uniref:PepSY domain-containing protein n=1 Tax=Siculibacillus lacustris TaxID=1549641 RepID=A0A4Q9VPH3_9HYPH|nr:hypothetical protein [Siculibacillus lacustris]TBW37646.1 hypothetical protein EYW49_11105 [Siculibacillus lacustris]
MRAGVVVAATMALAIGSGAAQADPQCRSGRDAGVPATTVPFKSGEFRRTGPALACSLAKETVDRIGSGNLERLGNACNRIGPLEIAMERNQVAPTLGTAPWKVLRNDGADVDVYLIRDSAQPIPVGYWVVSSVGGRVTALQETAVREGWASPLPHAFSSIRPGDPVQRALDVLGTPARICTGPEIKGDLWRWDPYGISMEMSSGRVFSIRTQPSGAERRPSM